MLEEFDVDGGVLRVTMAMKNPNPAPLSTRLTANPTLKKQKQTNKQQKKMAKRRRSSFSGIKLFTPVSAILQKMSGFQQEL